MIDDPLVEIIATEMVVTIRGKDFNNAFANLYNGYVKSTAAKIVHHNFLRCPVIESRMQERHLWVR